MKVIFLSNKISWFGKYSGYECLNDYFVDKKNHSIYRSKSTLIKKIVGKYYQITNKWNNVQPIEIQAGIEFMNNIKKNKIAHILYLESHIHLLDRIISPEKKLIGTIHLPISQWNEEKLELISKAGNIIILYKEEVHKFSKYIDKDRIHFIQHGVDTNFFKPGPKTDIIKNKILFVGHYLRNFDMFMKVYESLSNDIPDDLEFHIIIPSFFREKIPVVSNLLKKNNTVFHEKLSDEELLREYQTSYLLLMPMEDSGANTAIVQAIASGLPVITTDVGGIRSYGGGDIFPIVPNDSHAEMITLFKYYYNNPTYRDELSLKMRDYAIKNLDWDLIAQKHNSLYMSLNH
ncbi:glycosyltransferase family 4 protein [Hymenobacter norwichensis]|uniref:glycosyltransferase family 4 protein n=1 Tax=Hymenobacter norwichensis TaxID=223903 RepID=UPI0003B514C1|nr:glycosyltransferase family 4 protein [Hymenobacter norwichensis]